MTGVAIPKIDAPLVGSKHQTRIIPQKKLNAPCREDPRNVIPPSMELFGLILLLVVAKTDHFPRRSYPIGEEQDR